jgi:hypothetical protein
MLPFEQEHDYEQEHEGQACSAVNGFICVDPFSNQRSSASGLFLLTAGTAGLRFEHE